MHTYTQGGGKGGPKMGPGPHQVSKLQKTTTLSTNAQSIVVLCGFQGPGVNKLPFPPVFAGEIT